MALMRRAIIAFLATLLVTSCSSQPEQTAQSPPPQAAASAPPPPPAVEAGSPIAVPPIPFADAARPLDVVRAVYMFAADHPEILSRVPCFCGCQTMGHRNNDDCFVASRDPAGRVTGWVPHGAT
jgi:hypothetical protein